MRRGGVVTEQQSNFGIHIDEPNVSSSRVTQNIIIGDKDILSLSLDANEQVGSSGLIFERDSRSDGHCFDSLSYQYKCKLLNVPYTNHPNTDWVFNNTFDISSSTFDIVFVSSSPQVGQHAISVFAENDLIDTNKSGLNLYVGSTTVDGITSTAGISIQVDDDAEDKRAKLTFMQANSKDNEAISVTLDQLALKSDIPAGVDLANYTGEVNLSEQKSFTLGGSTFNRSSIFSLASFDKDLFPGIPEEESEYIKGPYISYTLDIESDIQETVLALAGSPGFYTKTPGYSAFLSLDNQANLVYRQYFENKQQRTAGVHAGQTTSGVYSVYLDAHGFSDSAGTAGFAQIEVYAYGSNQGIEFRQNNLNNGQPITLESILNRIAQLESTVSELQTQLAAKANTASPTFTGKASINSSN